jgi:hypothetical protein
MLQGCRSKRLAVKTSPLLAHELNYVFYVSILGQSKMYLVKNLLPVKKVASLNQHFINS